jgi:hypothetical protein
MTASKNVRHVIRFRILFHFLFLSLASRIGKGDTPKGILLREGSGPRAPLLIRGSKAGPSKGFNSRLRALGLRAHYWSEVRRPAPSPPTNHRFEGWPLGRVQQPPQSTWAPRPLLVRGSKASPSEGFNGCLRPLGLRAHY